MDEHESPPSFQFYPRDLISSKAVRLMSPEARGGYLMLLCHAWMSEEPGILEDDDATLAGLSELGERWPACAVAIRRAFRSTSREGRKVLVQDRMLKERAAQRRRYEQASKGARATNDKRWTSVALRFDSDSLYSRSAVTPASASASASASESISPAAGAAPPSPPRRKRRPRGELIRTITPEQRAAAAERFSLDLTTVNVLADKIELEFDTRGYSSAPSALLTWCKREKEAPAPQGNGHAQGSRRGTGPLGSRYSGRDGEGYAIWLDGKGERISNWCDPERYKSEPWDGVQSDRLAGGLLGGYHPNAGGRR